MKNIFTYLKQGNNFLSVSFGLGFLLIAISISYALLIKPVTKRISLDECLDSIQEQKRASDEEYKASHITAKSAYDAYLNESSSAPDNRLSQKDVSDAEAKCYDRYK